MTQHMQTSRVFPPTNAGKEKARSASLRVNKPGDRWEQEARRSAVNLDNPGAALGSAISPVMPDTLQREGDSLGNLDAGAVSGIQNTISGAGESLPPVTRQKFEEKVGHDFSNVRVHAGEQASRSVGAANASAYTTGNHIAFGAGHYSPHTRAGKKLLAHELTHVAQQRQGAGQGVVQREDPTPAPSADKKDFKEEFVLRYKEIREKLPDGKEKLPEDPMAESEEAEKAAQAPVTGHTRARYIQGWGQGFNAIQNYLNKSSAWSDVHEEAQNLIRDFAEWKLNQSGKTTPESVKNFLSYIGRSESNAKATDLYNFKKRQAKEKEVARPADLGGSEGANDWCAGASSRAFMNVLRDQGLTVGDYDKWLSKGKGKELMIQGAEAATADLFPGDVITIITDATPLTGHVATVADFDPSSKRILLVSGNAGGGGSKDAGTIRFDQVTRETPPTGYDYLKVAELGKKIVRLEGQQKSIQSGKANEVKDWVTDEVNQVSRGVVNREKQKEALGKVAAEKKVTEGDSLLQTRAGSGDKEGYSPKPTKPGIAWVTVITRLGQLVEPGKLKNMSKDELANRGIVPITPGMKKK